MKTRIYPKHAGQYILEVAISPLGYRLTRGLYQLEVEIDPKQGENGETNTTFAGCLQGFGNPTTNQTRSTWE